MNTKNYNYNYFIMIRILDLFNYLLILYYNSVIIWMQNLIKSYNYQNFITNRISYCKKYITQLLEFLNYQQSIPNVTVRLLEHKNH